MAGVLPERTVRAPAWGPGRASHVPDALRIVQSAWLQCKRRGERGARQKNGWCVVSKLRARERAAYSGCMRARANPSPDPDTAVHPSAADTFALRRRVRFLLGELSGSWREHTTLFGVLGAYLTFALSVDLALPEHDVLTLGMLNRAFGIVVLLFTLGFLMVLVLREAGRAPADRSLTSWLWRRLRCEYLTPSRVFGAVLMVVFGCVLTDTFMSLKAAIPILHPFSWDTTLMHWDRLVHFGRHPWELLQPFMSPLITSAVSVAYNVWIFLVFGIFYWQAWSSRRRLRMQFFFTFAFSWILLGSVAATVFSSAGPCYYSRVTGVPPAADPYAPLLRYLRAVDSEHRVWALAVQDQLWENYAQQEARTRGNGYGLVFAKTKTASFGATGADTPRKLLSGISAMPSMHVAMAVLFALVGWRTNRWLGLLFTAYAAVILVGSVHLGWHYAIDGYASLVAVLVIWWCSGRSLRQRTATRLAPDRDFSVRRGHSDG